MSRELNRYKDFYDRIIPHCTPYDFQNKENGVTQHILYMLNRTQSMFKWENLPDTIPQRILELYLQVNGNVCFYEYKNNLYVFTGGLGGEPDVYYMPTIYTIANPALKLSKSLRINEECVVIPNDAMYLGLLPMFSRYATQLTETELSIDIAVVQSRIVDLISAPDDRTKESAEIFLKNIRDGKPGVIAENTFLDGIKAQPYGATGNRILTDLIETMQYTKASWFNDLGLNANYNMKRESLNTTESQLNNDALLPLIDNMLESRRIGIEKVNEMFGTNITVDFASSWEDNMEEIELQHEQLENPEESENPEEEMGENENENREDKDTE